VALVALNLVRLLAAMPFHLHTHLLPALVVSEAGSQACINQTKPVPSFFFPLPFLYSRFVLLEVVIDTPPVFFVCGTRLENSLHSIR
jgi:hypothetical protein